MEKRVYRSRISVLLVGVLLTCFLHFLLPIFILLFRSGIYIGFCFFAGIFVLLIFLFCGMSYELTEKQLILKICGGSYFTFPLSVIASVERSYNPLSSPAGSLKRLKIRMKKGYKFPYALVSPVREQEFLETLKQLNPDINIRVSDKKGWHRIYRIWDWDI